jgi:PTS system mannose-specific IID component
MQFFHALIIALLTWLIATAAPMWLRWSMYFGAPLVAGLINGLLLGDLTYGLQCGATIMMAYIGLVAIGGSLPSDLSLAGYLGVYMTMISGADPSVGLPIAVSLGFLGILCSNAKMALNPIWVHRADKYAAEGNTTGVVTMNLLASQIVPFITYFIPAFLCVMLGGPFMEQMLNVVPPIIISILKLIGAMIPALGLAMLMNMMNKRSTIPFFLMGFVLAAYLKLDIIALAILGVAFGLMHLLYTSYGKRGEENV